MEANPESISRATAGQYLREGVNRVSLGAQSLDDTELAMLGRGHCAADVTRAVYALRDAHFHNIGLDLIWGLPGQTSRRWKKQLKEVARLRPEHLSCYGLTLEEGTPMRELCESGALLPLPDEREAARMYVQGAELLEELGYLQYEISNFARMGYLCRHNMGYWEGEDYLGLGPSATSTIGGRRWTNPANIGRWARQVKRHATGADAEKLDLTDRVLELIMLRLRTARGLRVKAYRELTGRDFLRDHKPLVHALHRHGLVRIKDGYLRLTRNGMLVSNSILERFFDASRERCAPGKRLDRAGRTRAAEFPLPFPGLPAGRRKRNESRARTSCTQPHRAAASRQCLGLSLGLDRRPCGRRRRHAAHGRY